MLAPDSSHLSNDDPPSARGKDDGDRRVLPFRTYFDPRLEPIQDEPTEDEPPKGVSTRTGMVMVHALPEAKKKQVAREPVLKKAEPVPGEAFSVTIPSGVFDWRTGPKVNVVEIKSQKRRPPKLLQTGEKKAAKKGLKSELSLLERSLPDFERSISRHRAKKEPKRLLAAGILVLTGIVVAVGLVATGSGFRARTVGVPDSKADGAGVVQAKAREFTVADSKKHLEQFFAAKTVEEALPMVWDEGETAEHMKSFYARRLAVMGGEITGGKPTLATVSNRTVHWWMVQTPDGIDRIAGVIWDSNRPHLLWEHFVGYGDFSWDNFLETTPETSAMMRIVMRAPDQILPFMGNACWAIVSHPDSVTSSYAVVTDAIAAKHLNDFFLKGEEGTLATVEMGYRSLPDGKPLLEIRRLFWPDWGEHALDTVFRKRKKSDPGLVASPP